MLIDFVTTKSNSTLLISQVIQEVKADHSPRLLYKTKTSFGFKQLSSVIDIAREMPTCYVYYAMDKDKNGIESPTIFFELIKCDMYALKQREVPFTIETLVERCVK